MSTKIRDIIRELNRIDLETVEYQKVVEKIIPLVTQIPMFIQMSKSTELFFRSRICNYKRIECIDELFAPPNELVKGFQRCNPPKKSMFYSSSKRITTLLECNVTVGDIVYLSQWINKEPTPLNILLCNNIETNLQQISSDQEIITSYLDTIFTRPIHKSFSNAYKISAAITELITNNFKPNKEQDIREDKKVALVYPSILDIQGSYNTVFSPNLAKERLLPLHIMKLKVIEKNGRSIKVKIIDNAREIIDGIIIWLNDENKIPTLITNRNKLQFQWTGKVWSIPIQNSLVTQNDIEKLLNE